MKRAFVPLFSAVLLCVGLAIPISAGDQTAAAFGDSQLTAPQLSMQWHAHNGDYVMFRAYDYTVAKGKTKKLKLNASGHIKWKSSNPRIATVSKKGVVKGKKNGRVTITAKRTTTGSYDQCTVKVYTKTTQKKARKAINSLKRTYYEGRSWTSGNYYFWECASMHAYGCVSFAAICSDKAFGKYAPLKQHYSFKRIKVGDIVRMLGNASYSEHSVVVLKKNSNSIVVAEGNYNDSIHWGRVITYDELLNDGFYVYTRY